jgi:hypothetical protein
LERFLADGRLAENDYGIGVTDALVTAAQSELQISSQSIVCHCNDIGIMQVQMPQRLQRRRKRG